MSHRTGSPVLDLTDEISIRQERKGYADLSRDEVIKAIRRGLKRRTGMTWSVTGGRGTAYGWISITAPPKRRTGVMAKVEDPAYYAQNGVPRYELVDSGEPQEFGYMTPADIETLREALNLERVHHQGVSIPSSTGHYVEYIARAEGRNPSTYGVQYWD